MRRRHVLAVLLAASVAVVAACGAQVRDSGGGGGSQGGGGGEGENAPVQLAVVPKAIGFDFWEQVRLGAECAAKKASGQVDVQWDGVTSETDVNGQVNLLQNFITQGVDGLVYAATDAKVLSKVTQSAKQQGVTVVNIDSGTDPQPSDVPVFATDNVAAAEQVPELMAKELGKEGGEVAFIPFQQGTLTNEQREEGFKKGLKQHHELELVAEQSSQSDYNKAVASTVPSDSQEAANRISRIHNLETKGDRIFLAANILYVVGGVALVTAVFIGDPAYKAMNSEHKTVPNPESGTNMSFIVLPNPTLDGGSAGMMMRF